MYEHSAMKSGKRSIWARIAAVALAGLLLAACGGSRNAGPGTQGSGEEVDIDKLLGAQDPSTSPQAADDENEVLRLLGLAPDTADMSNAMASKEAVAVEPQPDMEKLQNELNEKDKLIVVLRNDVSDKDLRIQQLQAELDKAQSSSGRAVGGDYASRYAYGRELYEQRNYREAINVFSALLMENDKNSLADNAQYWIGECYYGLGNYAQSVAEFEKIFTFPRSDKSDDAQLKLGLCYLRMGDRQQAKNSLEQLLATYPNSEYANKARQYLARL